jgi:hypothetical protein
MRTARTAAALVVAVAALALVAVAARSGRTATLTPITARSAGATPTAEGTLHRPTPQPAPPPQPDEGFRMPPIVLMVLALLAVAGLIGVAVWLLRRFRGRHWPWWWIRKPGLAPEPALDPGPASAMTGALTEAVDSGLRRLDEGPARDAVIACWVLLESTAAEAGTARRPAETAAELTTRVLQQHRVTAGTLRQLADLYREARYSSHLLGDDAREQARAALARVRRELGEEAVR